MRSPCCLCVCPSNIERQQLGKHVTATMNTFPITEELSDAVFSVQSVKIIYYVVKEKYVISSSQNYLFASQASFRSKNE
jgi:hypothetical protein